MLWQNSVYQTTNFISKVVDRLDQKPQRTKALQKCPEYIEDEAHFLLDCSDDSDIKSDLVKRIAIDSPQVSVMADKYIKYKLIMKIQDPDILRYLWFSVTLLFKNREDRTQNKMRPNPDEV